MSELKADYNAKAAFKLISPVPAGSIVTQTFAEHEQRRKDKNLKYYNGGIDYGVPTGTPIKAAASGVVKQAGHDTTGYGVHVRIDHGGGYLSLYGHLDTTCVRVGQHVNAGDIVGISDSTGNSTGPHLHFELRKGGAPVDPEPLLMTDAAGAGETEDAKDVSLPGIPVDLEFVVAVASLRRRSGPGTTYSELGQVRSGDRVRVKRLHCNPVWVELEDGSFCALQIGDEVFLKPVE